MNIPVTATGVTEDLMYCVDKCAYEKPLSAEDIACFREKPCGSLATSVRSMRPGECSEG